MADADRQQGQGKDGLPILACGDRGEWAAWLEANHGVSPGVWLRIARKGAKPASPSTAEALEVALCHGWIDGQAAPYDEAGWLQRYTPRRARSKWSLKNREAALQLIESGQMRPAGLAAVRAAQADGRWDQAYASPSRMEVPADLEAALSVNAAAAGAFAALSSTRRYAILYRLHDAKRPETRARRIAKFVAMLAAGDTAF